MSRQMIAAGRRQGWTPLPISTAATTLYGASSLPLRAALRAVLDESLAYGTVRFASPVAPEDEPEVTARLEEFYGPMVGFWLGDTMWVAPDGAGRPLAKIERQEWVVQALTRAPQTQGVFVPGALGFDDVKGRWVLREFSRLAWPHADDSTR